MQTKKQSFIESCVNVGLGWASGVLSQIILFPFFGIAIPVSQNMILAAWFTFISLIRSYIVRRWFNKKETTCLTTNGS